MGWSQLANAVGSGMVAAAAAVFVTVYHRLAPWRASATGRHVMAMSAVLGLLGLYTLVISLWPQAAPVLRVVRVVVIVSMAALLIQRTRMVIRAQRDDDH